jgi:alpha-galactosidase
MRDNSTGEYRWDPERFPSGIPALVQYLNARGLQLGVYTDSGTQTCSSGGRPIKVPGSEGHYAQDAATFAKWGVGGVKMDW